MEKWIKFGQKYFFKLKSYKFYSIRGTEGEERLPGKKKSLYEAVVQQSARQPAIQSS